MEFIRSDEFQFWNLKTILKHAVRIPRSRPWIFFLMHLCFIMPLTTFVMCHSLALLPLVNKFYSKNSPSPMYQYRFYFLLFLCHCLYLLVAFVYFLFCTALFVLAVASIYISFPTTFSTILFALPRIISRLFLTFFWLSLVILSYHAIFNSVLPVATILVIKSKAHLVFKIIGISFLAWVSIVLYVFVSIVWQFSSVVSVLEPFGGRAAMKRCMVLLKGKMFQATLMMAVYLGLFGAISMIFDRFVGNGRRLQTAMWVRILVGVMLVILQSILISVGMLVQSLFYYVCKSFHHEIIDKNALTVLLGGYIKIPAKLNCLV